MSKAAVHVEVKLMWTGRDMELLVVFNQPFPSAHRRTGFCGSTSLLTPAHWVHGAAVLTLLLCSLTGSSY